MSPERAEQPLAIPDLHRLAASDQWRPFRAGVDIITIYQRLDGQSAALLRYQPGASVAHHQHAGFEHVLVLSGSQVDARGEYPAGALIVNTPGSSHAVSSPRGCVVLVIWEKPIVFTSPAPPAA